MDPVIIAGAGPSGLVLALCLARHSVPTVLLDETEKDAELPAAAERTVVLGPHAAGLLARLGVPPVEPDGTGWTAWRTLRRRQQAVRVEFGKDGGPSPVHIAQHLLERRLRDALAGQSRLARIVPGSRVGELEQDDRGVTVRTGGSAGTRWRGSYLVGCDGPRSTVRKQLGVRFPGRTAVDRHAVAALRVELPYPGEALLHRDPPVAAMGLEVTARPLPGGVWRVDWMLPERDERLTADELVARIRGTLAAWCGDVPPYELLGSCEYTMHQRLALNWRVGRVFLAGDAAHLMGALGTRSVEEGLRDVENLAWKLSLAWHQGASEVLLDSYQAERRGAVGARLRATDQVLPLVRADGAWHALRRTVLAGSVRRYAELLTDSHLGRGPLGAPPVYEHSPLAAHGRGAGVGTGSGALVATPCATPPGAEVEDVPVTGLDGTRARLRDRLGRDLLVLLVAPGTGVWESRHWLTAGLMPGLGKAVEALPAKTELLVTEAYPGTTAHSVLLIRPDGHLVSVMTGSQPTELRSHVDQVCGDSGTATEDRVPQ